MSFYTSSQKSRFRARIKELDDREIEAKNRERSALNRLKSVRRSIMDKHFFVGLGLSVQRGLNLKLIREKIRVLKLIRWALSTMGLAAMPSLRGIGGKEARILAMIRRRKIAIWMFFLDRLKYQNEIAMARRDARSIGGSLALENGWILKNNDLSRESSLSKMRENLRSGRSIVENQMEMTWRERMNTMRSSLITGRNIVTTLSKKR